MFNVSRVIQFTFGGYRGSAGDFHIVTNTAEFHEAKCSAKILLNKFNSSYHVIYQAAAVKSHMNSEVQKAAGIYEKTQSWINAKLSKYFTLSIRREGIHCPGPYKRHCILKGSVPSQSESRSKIRFPYYFS